MFFFEIFTWEENTTTEASNGLIAMESVFVSILIAQSQWLGSLVSYSYTVFLESRDLKKFAISTCQGSANFNQLLNTSFLLKFGQLNLSCPGGHIVPAGSVSRPLRFNRQSYEPEIWNFITFHQILFRTKNRQKKFLSVKYISRTGPFVGDGWNLSVIGDVPTRSWFL